MEDKGSYGQFCPVAMAAEVLCSRWTVLVLREMLAGSTRFNELRRGVPRMSPALLSKRLKELEAAGVVVAAPGERGVVEYRLSPAGEELRPIVMGMGFWGQRWIESQLSLKNLDPSLLMWDMRRNLRVEPMPPRRCTIAFQYPELAENRRHWWLVVNGGAVDLCSVDPGFEVDLYVVGSLRALTAIWMGLTTVGREVAAKQLELLGDAMLARSIEQWLGLSPFAGETRKVA
ncbi:transcriptional regulator [Falsiroseomonas bella]|uniref:Transcriptional regulator n=1 Tax=Falsiroseomonas bella TaxID=2184016 RepID=A0A317FDY8_9PROT|nr:helix-turn-helix domain-containing protein [Falsiroseomonas bella]PWS36753.1 transcriptional regulator [Falsiroseomonas bella]